MTPDDVQALKRREWMKRADDKVPEILRLFGYIDHRGTKSIDLQTFLKV